MEKKTKKKFGILAVALVLLLAIGATIGTTLAKYVTEATIESEQATVAQWGVTVTVDKSGLFGKTYNKGSIVANEEGGVDVKSTANVVAPGTQGGALTATVNGTPQVKSKLTVALEVTDTVFVKYSEASTDKYYYPIEWTVAGEKVTVADAETLDYTAYLAALKTAINAKVAEKFAKTYEAGATINESISNLITWSWAFEVNDEADTLLGNLAAGVGTEGKTAKTDYCTQIAISGSIKMEQVQSQN